MRHFGPRTARVVLSALLLSFIYPTVATTPSFAAPANPACAPTQTTLNGMVVLEFNELNASDSNTNGNTGYTCDWTVPANVYSINVVIVGGGGSGGYGNQAGGGGGGEVLYTSNGYFTTPNGSITLKIGAGGAAVPTNPNAAGNNGATSTFASITAHGGGGGGSGGPFSGSVNNGITGGSSGGGDRFGTSVAGTGTTESGWLSLVNAGGRGAGLQSNPAANSLASTSGPAGCYAFGAGGGGGGAMSAGTDASASCGGNGVSDTISVRTGNGGAGAFLLGKCLAGGGGSVFTDGYNSANPTQGNQATSKSLIASTPTECIDPTTSQFVAGTVSGGYASDVARPIEPVANTGAGSAAGNNGFSFRGSHGVIFVTYDPTFPPVAPIITAHPQSATVAMQQRATETVTATVNDSGTVTYCWQTRAPGVSAWTSYSCTNSTLYWIPTSVSDSGTQFRVAVKNTRSGLTTTTYSNIATISVVLATPVISLFYPDSNTATYFLGETLTPTLYTNSDRASAATFSTLSPASVCSVNSTTGVVSVAGGGACTVRYSVPSSTNYSAASASVTINISKRTQRVTWSSLPNLSVTSAPVTLGVTSGYLLASGDTSTGAGTITYSASSCSAFSVTSSGTITPRAVGSCSITATQSSTNTHSAALVAESLTIVAAVPDAPFINSVSASGDTGPTSGAVTVNFTDNGTNGANITSYRLSAVPVSGATLYDTETVGAGTHSGTITGLTLGTAYTISIYATNSAGNSATTTYSIPVTPAGAPFAVTQLSATPGDGTLDISYVGPASLNGGSWNQYQYFVTPAGTPFSDTPTATDNVQAHTTRTFTGLSNGVAYNIKVVALTTANGAASSANTTLLNMVPATTPNAPMVLITQTSATAATVAWASQGDGGSAITGYTITLTKNGSAQSCYVNLTTTSCNVTGLVGEDVLSISATATNLIGTSTSRTATYSIIGVVAKPTALTTSAGDTTLRIDFTQNSSGDVITTFLYSLDGQATSVDALTNQSPIIIAGLTNDQAVSVNIRAVGQIYGAGVWSDLVTDTPTAPAPPNPPSNDNSGGGGYSPSAPVTAETTTVADTTTAIETSTGTAGSETSTTLPTTNTNTWVNPGSNLLVARFQFSVPYRTNSYFLNDAARSAIKKIAKKYSKAKIKKIVILGYVSASRINPYPRFLGTQRAKALKTALIAAGLKAKYVAKYGGYYKGSRAGSLRPLILIYISN